MKNVKKALALTALGIVMISFFSPPAKATKDKPFERIREYRAFNGEVKCPLGPGLCNF